ncbi:synaptic vesicle glycoprotein 2A-like [Chrysoperla carnea]|uniref:synaptic vesicle glycoprotein 2A-like n=1 Tax=Chrysoperla carnea TaxID=189513 RepID=UPI001D05D838|nr:synaptic vesicle glycoprotein 2A-like [Chrysoperla carnea]
MSGEQKFTSKEIKQNKQDYEFVPYDTALSLTTYGKFQYNLIGASALTLLATGSQYGLSAYVLPSAQCELQLTSAQVGFINVMFMIGCCLSSFLWGILADTGLGRRNILIATLFSDSILTISSSLIARSLNTLVIFRLLNGFVIGAPATLIFSYLGEFHTQLTRHKCLCYTGMFYTLSWVLLPAIAWAIIPLPIHWSISSTFTILSWRVYMATIGIMPLIAAIWLCFLPPSPKLLLVKGHSEKALNILRKMYEVNTGMPKETFPVKHILNETSNLKKNQFENEQCHEHMKSSPTPVNGKTARILRDIMNQICSLLKPPLLSYTCLVMFMMFANMFGYYGMGLWLPEFIKRFDAHYSQFPNNTITVCGLFEENYLENFVSHPEPLTMLLTSPESALAKSNNSFVNAIEIENYITASKPEIECVEKIETNTFINTIIMGTVCLCGNILSGVIAGFFKSRRLLPIALAAIGGITSAIIFWVTTAEQNVIVASICLTAFATGNMVLNSVIVDIFPTSVSALAVCTATFAGRVGAIICNLVFGLLLEISCEIPFFLVSAVVLASAVMGFLIPEGPVNSDYPSRSISQRNSQKFTKNKQTLDVSQHI